MTRKQHHGKQHPAGPKLKVRCVGRQHFLHQQQGGCAQHTAPHGAHAAENYHYQQGGRLRPVQQIRAHIALQVGAEATGDSADYAGDNKDRQFAGKHRQAKRLGAHLVVAQRLHSAPETRVTKALKKNECQRQRCQCDVIKSSLIAQVKSERQQ